jgi:hypothetical protein
MLMGPYDSLISRHIAFYSHAWIGIEIASKQVASNQPRNDDAGEDAGDIWVRLGELLYFL